MQIIRRQFLATTVSLFTLTWATTLTLALGTEEITVTVYDGPKSCQEFDAENKPVKVQKDFSVAFHFTASDEATGRKIESSHDLGVAPSFTVGQGKVISGLDQGLIGLCKHAKAHIVIPPHLAYGTMGKPEQGVTKDTVLRYDVEIIDIQPPAPNDFKDIDTNKDWKISKSEAKYYFESKSQNIDIDALFNAEDADHDGYVSWEEFSGPKGTEGPPSTRQRQQQQEPNALEQVAAIFQQIDIDHDGKISKEELAATFQALGEEMTDEFWTESDTNGDGFVSIQEFVGNSGREEL
jgi:FK506-binding protein 14